MNQQALEGLKQKAVHLLPASPHHDCPACSRGLLQPACLDVLGSMSPTRQAYYLPGKIIPH